MSADVLPTVLLTGFLGSGKTSLLRHLLVRDDMAGAMVIVNEVGEVGLDHLLVGRSGADDEPVMLLDNGCLCCETSGDLVRTLVGLTEQRAAGALGFDRLFIETTGVADPMPVIATLAGEPRLKAGFALAGVAVTLDALTGPGMTERHDVAGRQLRAADLVVITKPDLVDGSTIKAVVDAIGRTAPAAAVAVGVEGAAPLAGLSTGGDGRRAPEPVAPAPHEHAHARNHGYESVCLTRESPVALGDVARFVRLLCAGLGPDFLRSKGLVLAREDPSRPAVVQSVQHVLNPVQWLEDWRGRTPRMEFIVIGRNLDRNRLDDLLDRVTSETARPATRDAVAASSAPAQVG